MTAPLHVVTRHPDFRRLFGASTVSHLGSSVTTVALPLTAVSHLGASPLQMGLLSAGALLPTLLFAVPAGVWLTRLPYRRVLVVTDLLQGLLLATIPALALLGLLQLWHLVAIVLLTGTCSLLEALAAESFLPTLVPRDDLLAANGARALSTSVVTTTGNGLGGALVLLLTAPVSLAVDACSFLLAAWWTSRISTTGHRPRPPHPPREPLRRRCSAGFRTVLGRPALRSLTVAATLGAFAGQVQGVVLVLHLVRELHLTPVVIGLVLAVAGVAGVLGALAGPTITAALGHGPTFVAGMVVAGLPGLVLAAAAGPAALVVTAVVAAQLLRGSGPALYGMNQQTIRQTLVPPDLLPQALATWRVLVFGVQPLGALAGGALGELVGLRTTLVAGSVLMLLAAAVAFAGPLRRLRTLTEPPALQNPVAERSGDHPG